MNNAIASMDVSVLKKIGAPIKLTEAPPDTIKAVQFILQQANLYTGKIDGIYQTKTLQAFNEYKEKEYLGYPDILGKTTALALLEDLEHPAPKDISDTPKNPSKTQVFVSGVGLVYADQPIIDNGNFTWSEATRGFTRMPSEKAQTQGIIKIAIALEEIRNLFGDKPITVTSWLRPLLVNRACGGASNSRHLYGDGVDFQVAGVHPQQVFQKLNNWYGRRGGLASSNTFTHVDARGYAARWKYS